MIAWTSMHDIALKYQTFPMDDSPVTPGDPPAPTRPPLCPGCCDLVSSQCV